mmetsp:Transcript_45783/g.121404  ORF Transcript_45783/g.121404 Transcript_45783/m.121404 type:complete len:261 (-) Transcript_45783:255-1037(-)
MPGALHACQPGGGSQWSSWRRAHSNSRVTFSTFHRHWSKNMSSPHLQGPEHSPVKCCRQWSFPRPNACRAFREKTSTGPCMPILQLFRYAPWGLSECRVSRLLSLFGRKTASGSTLAVHPCSMKRPSSKTLAHRARKMSVFSAVPNSPPFSHRRSLSIFLDLSPGARSSSSLLYTAYSSQSKMPRPASNWPAMSSFSSVQGITRDRQSMDRSPGSVVAMDRPTWMGCPDTASSLDILAKDVRGLFPFRKQCPVVFSHTQA